MLWPWIVNNSPGCPIPGETVVVCIIKWTMGTGLLQLTGGWRAFDEVLDEHIPI